MTVRERRTLRVEGVVQGVGFRPFVHRLARQYDIGGFVRNDATHVHIEVEGPPDRLDRFCRHLVTDAPPLARIDDVVAEATACRQEVAFRISASGGREGDEAATLIPPDTAICDDCRRELFDPADRRHRHPFITCTNCGPRFTIIRSLPYDRANTTMAAFAMCVACRAEYEDPNDRRYHAQPIACHDCGPTLRYRSAGSSSRGTEAVLTAVLEDLQRGLIVAVKGIGGYHLAVDATDDDAILRLRRRKVRPDKPFAVMVPDGATARQVAHLDPSEVESLVSPAHPIVLARARADSGLAPSVAPGNPLVGLMLPYSPLHHLLFAAAPGSPEPPAALVMTSGNVAEEPICFVDADAEQRLRGIADGFCAHDRPIVTPCDDSVVRVVEGAVLPIRRSRGFAPLPVSLPSSVPPTLAVGGELKTVFAVASGRTAWLSHHLGDMENLETLRAMETAVDAFGHLTDVEVRRIVADCHPAYRTRRWARTQTSLEFFDVQHHHAHLAALMAEHGLDGTASVIGFVFDGTGHGADDTSWGGEVLIGGYSAVERWGHLMPVDLPAGDGAARNPCRSALSHLYAAGMTWREDLPPVRACDPIERRVLRRQLERSVNCVPSSSVGRLFDAVASLLGLRHRASYEGQAAIELEGLAASAEDAAPLRFDITGDGVLDPRTLLRSIVDGVLAGTDAAELARGFHLALADAIVDCATSIRRERGIDAVGLTGGVFQNVLLATEAADRLRNARFTVLTHRLVPPNDAGIALGQMMVASTRPGER